MIGARKTKPSGETISTSKDLDIPPSGQSGLIDDIFDKVPRGVIERQGKKLNRDQQKMPNAQFLLPSEIVSKPELQFSSDKIFLGVLGERVEPRKGRNGQIDLHVLGGIPIGIGDDRHIITIAGSRGGKGRSGIIPTLLTYSGSCLTLDPKGELANITARARENDLKQEVHVLDPFKITKGYVANKRVRFNPLSILNYDRKFPDDLKKTSNTLVEDAELIADAIVIPSGGDSHWDDSARQLIHGLILHVATCPVYRHKRHLIMVRELLMRGGEFSDPDTGEIRQSLEILEKQMQRNAACRGVIQDAAADFFEKPDNERGSVLSSARKHTYFLNYPSIQDNLTGSDFELSSLKKEKATIYLCLPAMRLGTCNRWFRMFINLTLAALEKEQIQPNPPVLLCLDEFAVLGHMKTIEDAAGQVAGFGVKLWPIIQDLGQLQALYKDRWQTFMGNAGVLVFHSNNDAFTLEFISKRIGTTSLEAESKSQLGWEQRNTSGSDGSSWSVQTQPLMTLEEVSKYFGRDDPLQRQLIIWASYDPMILQRAKYDSHELFDGLADE